MMSIKLSRRAADLGLFATFLVIAVLAYLRTATFPSPLLPGYPGSAMFPRLVLATMGVICVFGLLRALLRPSADAAPVTIEIGPFAAIVAAIAAFGLALTLAGMEVAVFAFIGGALFYRTRKIGLAVGCGLAAVIVTYALFVQALSVHLPLTFLPRYLSTVF